MVRIWEEIDQFLTSANTAKDLTELLRILLLPPYGLRERTLGLILAPALRKYVLHNNLIIQWKGEPIIRIDGGLLEERLILRWQQIRVRYQEVTDKHKLIWHAVAEAYGSTDSDLESAYRAVVNWWRGLPNYSRYTDAISDQSKEFRQSFLEPLSAQEKDKTELFNAILPELVGIDDFSMKTDQEVEEDAKRVLLEVKDDFENSLYRLHEKIKSAILEILGDEEQLWSYYSKLAEAVRSQILTGDAYKLMEWLRKLSSQEHLDLQDFVVLAESILGTCQNWGDEHIFKLKGHLESARNQIEGYPPSTVNREQQDESSEIETQPGKITFRIGDKQRIFTLYESLDEAPNKEQVKILLNLLRGGLLSTLKNGQITADEFLSIIYHLIKEYENA